MFGMYVAVLLSARMSGGGLVCSDRAGNNACAACCHSYTPAGEPFEKCVQNCKPPPTPLRIASVEPPTTLLPAGSTDINITVTTSATAAGGCKWAVPARGSSGSFRPAGSSGGLQFIALVRLEGSQSSQSAPQNVPSLFSDSRGRRSSSGY